MSGIINDILSCNGFTVNGVSINSPGSLIIGGASGPSIATLTAGSNISITNGNGSITISGNSGVTWQTVTSASNPITLAPSNGYIPKGGSQVIFILPPTAAIGDTFSILGYGNLWTITQNANQSITIGSVTSTVGVGGSVTATSASDALHIICVTSNNEFRDLGIQGNPTIV